MRHLIGTSDSNETNMNSCQQQSVIEINRENEYNNDNNYDNSGGADDDGDDVDPTEGSDESDDDDVNNDTGIDEESSSDVETESDQENISNLPESPISPNSAPTCYICLNIFEGQDIGSPDSCENMHYFCLECIEEWSKQINTCPVDRKSFSFIIVRRVINGEIVMKVPIAKKSVLEIVTLDNDVTYCEICGRCDREDRLLLCDGCDFGYHCECLVPPLETIPVDEWFCPDCFERLFGDDALLEENNQRQLVRRRALARTGTFERVRNRILARRSNENCRNTNSTANRRKKKSRTKKRKTSKKRKTQNNKSTSKKSKKSRRKYVRKRTKKSKMSLKRLPAADPRSRLATRLGLMCKPKSPFGLPITKPPNLNRSLSEVRYSAGISNLSLFGYELEMSSLRSYGDDSDVESSFGGSIGLLTNTRHIFPMVNNKTIKFPEPLLQINSTDVLSEIMNLQEILHTSSSDLSIARDGRVFLNPDAKSIRHCPNSNSPPSSTNSHSNINTTTTNNNKNNYNNYTTFENSNYSQENISFIKPSPVVSLIDDKNDIEMYSDIESVGDNKDIDDSNEENKKIKKEEANKHDKTNDDETENKISTDSKISNDSITSKGGSSVLKRRPSIKDLFGDDSEDDDDDDELKQLVAQQGSINVHYPIKMPIVLKTNFLANKKKPVEDIDDVPISKKWIPIYPEMNQIKNSGPKWKAIGENEQEKSLNVSIVKNDKKEVNNFNVKLQPPEEIFPPESKKSERSSNDTVDVSFKKSSSSTTDKVRTCKHGRPINKNKESSSKKYSPSEKLESRDVKIKSKVECEPKKSHSTNKCNNDDNDDESKWKKKNTSKSRNSKDDENQGNYRHKDEKYKKKSESDSKYTRKTEDSYEIKQFVYSKSKAVLPNKDKLRTSEKDSRSDLLTSKDSKTSSSKHRHHHHHHHRHHHRHKHNSSESSTRHQNTNNNKIKNTPEDKQAEKTTKTVYQSYPKMQMDSKEIIAEGDKIIVNVSFKKEEIIPFKSEEKNETKPKFDKNISNIETQSPQTSDSLGKSDNSIASPNENDFDSASNRIKTLSSNEIKNVLMSDEFKFLPRILPNNETANQTISHESKTSDDLFIDDDSFLPTPTQDESQSPILGGRSNKSLNKIDSLITTNTTSNLNDTTKDDFYDPELPLQSPDHDLIKSPKEKINFESSTSLKSSFMSISRDNVTSSKDSSLTTTAAQLASINSINRIIQFAQTIQNQNTHSINCNSSKLNKQTQQQKSSKENNHDIIEIVDMDVDSPSLSPTKPNSSNSSLANVKEIWDQIIKSASSRLENNNNTNINNNNLTMANKNNNGTNSSKRPLKMNFLDFQPTSAVDMGNKERFIKKLNRQERVVEEVKLALKPYYQKKKINKEEYKNILRKAVPKICHSKSGEINPSKINKLVDEYIKHIKRLRKKI